MYFQKRKTVAMLCGRFSFFRREPSASGATGDRLGKPERDVGWLLLAARGWRDFCFSSAKGMTAPKPVATSRRAQSGQPVDCNWLKRMEPEWNVRC